MNVEERARVFAALSDPNRLRLIELLAAEDELCGTQLAGRVGISSALLSHHWKILTDAGLVTREKRGQRQFCKLNRDALASAFEYAWPARRLQSLIASKP